MKKSVEDIGNELVDTFGEMSEWSGMTRIAGLMEGLLVLSQNPLSLDDMAERLEVSKGSISTNIRLLERWKMVRRVFNRNDRKNYYELRGGIWEIETEIVRSILKDELDRFTDTLARWKNDLAEADEDDANSKAFLAKRLEQIGECVDAGRHVLQLLTREEKITPAIVKKIQIV